MLTRHKIYIVSIVYGEGELPRWLQPALEKVLTDVSHDWLRVKSTFYLAWSLNEVVVIVKALGAVLRALEQIDGVQLLVAPLDDDAVPGGYLPPWMWRWINGRRAHPSANEPLITLTPQDYLDAGLTPPPKLLPG